MAETSELQKRIEAARAARETVPAQTNTVRQETDADRCTVCGNFEDEHADRYRHAFTTVKNDLRDRPEPATKPANRVPPSVLSTDIALRLALIDKGVLTADDIFAAEKKLGLHPLVAELGQPAEAPPVADHVD